MMLATRLDTVFKTLKISDAPKAVSPQMNADLKSTLVFKQIQAGITALPQAEKEATLKKVNAVYQFDIKTPSGSIQTWTVDLKKGAVQEGTLSTKADIVITIADAVTMNQWFMIRILSIWRVGN
jgi:hypothetical protein